MLALLDQDLEVVTKSARAASSSKRVSKLRSLAGLAFCEELVYFVVKAKESLDF